MLPFMENIGTRIVYATYLTHIYFIGVIGMLPIIPITYRKE